MKLGRRCLLLICFLAQTALAVPVPVPVPEEKPGRGTPEILALIVTNNRSAELGRRQLAYADDDGAKYYQVFRTLTAQENVALLTELDGDTEKLFPHLGVLTIPPSRKNVSSAAERLAKRATELKAQGKEVSFYFIFAGHGDVDKGRGFLELSDGALGSEELAALVRSVPAARSHVILDSCNSFFVLNPRKPGGTRFATPKDAAAQLAKTLPNVGVFLSTSAEAEVYEWSELQSGIFSHAVRSGLLGAADANDDGSISYEELSGFVDLSSSEVRNPLYRPKVFARGPNGENAEPLLDLSKRRSAALRIDEDNPTQLVIRDRDNLRWVDIHKEKGAALSIVVPEGLEGVLIERIESENGTRTVRERYSLPNVAPAGSIQLASLSTAESRHQSRGVDELFGALFARPFGAVALRTYLEEQKRQPAPVFGISREDSARMRTYLSELARSERYSRRALGIPSLAVGGMLGVMGASGLIEPDPDYQPRGVSVGMLAIGAAFAGLGTYALLTEFPGERAYREFEANADRPEVDSAQLVADAEMRIDAVARREANARLIIQWLLIGYGAAGGMALIFNEARRYPGPQYMDEREFNSGKRLIRATSVGIIGVAIAGAVVFNEYESPSEKIIRLWRADPSIQKLPRLSVGATPDGAEVSLSGTF